MVQILVTGGAGFIGCHLVEALVQEWPAGKITILDKLTSAVVPGALQRLAALANVSLVEGDICDSAAVAAVMRGQHLVFHLAAESHVPHSFANPDLFDRVNRLGARNVAVQAAAAGIDRLVHFSTDEVYGPCLFPANEDQVMAPTTPYALSKAAGEAEVICQRVAGLDAIILRPSNAVGYGQHPEKLFPRFVSALQSGRHLELEGGGSQRRTFMSVRDIAKAAIHACKHAERNATLNVAGADDLSIREVGELIGQTLAIETRFVSVPDRPVNDAAYRLDGSRLARLRFAPVHSLTDEIRSMANSSKRQVAVARREIGSPPIAPTTEDLLTTTARKISFHVPHRAASESANVESVLASGHMKAGGPFSRAAEEMVRQRTGSPHAYLTHSCTGAMETAIMALDIGPGDEVIVPTYTFAATATAAGRTGAKVVLCDVDPQTMMLNADTVQACITARTRALMVVHYGGASAPVQELAQLADRHGFHLIEDAAQCAGSRAHGHAVGTTGIFGALSFHDTKVIGAGHGGALLCNTNDPVLLRRVREILDRGTDFAEKLAGKVDFYQWVSDGSSFCMPEINAAVLCARLGELDCVLAHRRHIAEIYRDQLADPRFPWRILPGNCAEGSNNHIFALIADTQEIAETMIETSKAVGIALETHYAPLHVSPFAKRSGLNVRSFAGADNVWKRLVRLPLHSAMSLGDAYHVVEVLAAFGAKDHYLPQRAYA